MPVIFLFLLLGIPIIELMVMINVGSEIGAVRTVALTILSAVVGIYLVRLQGFKVVRDMQAAAAAGEPVGGKLIHGGFLTIAGALLFFPGFITDIIGALLLIPPIRQVLGVFIVRQVMKKSEKADYYHAHSNRETEVDVYAVVYDANEPEDKTPDGDKRDP